MSERMRTVASFDVTYRADLARAALEEAGIEAVVTDREIVAMDWLLANAVNGVKVQVAESDVGRALEVLERMASTPPDERPVSDAELEQQALAEPTEDGEPPDEPSEPPPPLDPVAEPTTDRDAYARRFMLTSVFSLLFPPLAVYAVYLGLNAVFGSGRMSSAGWQWVGFGMAFGGVLVMAVVWAVTMLL